MNKISLNLLSMIHICLPFIQSKLYPLQHESAEKHGSGNYIYVYKTNCVVWFISINKYTGICMLLKHTEIRGQIQRGALGLNILTVSCLSNPVSTPDWNIRGGKTKKKTNFSEFNYLLNKKCQSLIKLNIYLPPPCGK